MFIRMFQTQAHAVCHCHADCRFSIIQLIYFYAFVEIYSCLKLLNAVVDKCLYFKIHNNECQDVFLIYHT